jgi:predicted Rossmann fold nucleotide-binding protein DprA/Smf involved in DNA uptake
MRNLAMNEVLAVSGGADGFDYAARIAVVAAFAVCGALVAYAAGAKYLAATVVPGGATVSHNGVAYAAGLLGLGSGYEIGTVAAGALHLY